MKSISYRTTERAGFFSRLSGRVSENKSAFAVYCLLCLICVAVILFSAVTGNLMGVFNGILALLLFWLPALLEDQLRIRLSATLKILTMLFIFSAQILGEVGLWYARFPFWDDLLHWVNGMLFAAFGFSLAEICNRRRHATFRLSPFYLALVACCFSLSIGVLWEFLEFGIDQLLHTDMQKDTLVRSISSGLFSADGQTSVRLENITQTVITAADGSSYTVAGFPDVGLFDTMRDLAVDLIGALLFSLIGYFHVKRQSASPLVNALIPKVEPRNSTSEPTPKRIKRVKISKKS